MKNQEVCLNKTKILGSVLSGKSRYLGGWAAVRVGGANVRVKERYPGGRRCVQVGGQVFKRGRTSLQCG